jgi:hypothetical protein
VPVAAALNVVYRELYQTDESSMPPAARMASPAPAPKLARDRTKSVKA